MSLHEQIKEIENEEKKLAGVEVEEVEADEPEKDEPEEGVADDGAEAGKDDDSEGGAEAVETVAEEKPDAATFARMRKEASDAKKAAQALAEENARLKAPAPVKQPVEAKAADPEPDRALDPEAHFEWCIRRMDERQAKFDKYLETQETIGRQEAIKQGAVAEFTEYENNFKAKTPDYEAVTAFGVQKLTERILQENPKLHGDALGQEVLRRVLTLGAQGQSNGFDPAEFLYLTSKNFGYQPPAPAEEPAEPKKPDFKKIVEHKKKSASSLSAGGKSGKVAISKEAFADKSFGFSDFTRLSSAELRELEAM